MLEKSFKEELQHMLVQMQAQYNTLDMNIVFKGLSDDDKKNVDRHVAKTIHNERIEFARKLRTYRRQKTAEILNAVNRGCSKNARRTELTKQQADELNAELVTLRDLHSQIMQYMPRSIAKDVASDIKRKKIHQEHMKQLAKKEDDRLNKPLPLDEKIVYWMFLPITLPMMGAILLWEKHSAKPSVQAKKQERFLKNFRKHWKNLHAEKAKQDARRSEQFRKLWREMHTK